MNGQAVVGTLVAHNITDTVTAGNFTVLDNQINSAGVLTTQLQADTAYFDGETVLLNYTYEPDGYISSSGGRSLASLIIVFAALAIGVIALTPVIQSKVLDMIGR